MEVVKLELDTDLIVCLIHELSVVACTEPG